MEPKSETSASRWRSMLPTILAFAVVLLIWIQTQRIPSEPSGDSQSYWVGVASIDITPDFPLRLSGYAGRTEPTSAIEHPLKAKALAISNVGGTSPALLITVDAIGIPGWLSDELASRLSKPSSLPMPLGSHRNHVLAERLKELKSKNPKRVNRNSLAVCATHTHSAPQLRGVLHFLFAEGLSRDEANASIRYTEELLDKLERVAKQALKDLRPRTLHWSQGTLGFAVNRRELKDGKWIGFGVQRDGPVDHSLPILQVRSEDGSVEAVLATYACHCTTTGGDMNRIHGDWAGYAQSEIEQRHPGVTAMISIGCGADANPSPRGELAHAKSHGRAFADQVDRLLEQSTTRLNHPPVCRYAEIPLQHDTLLSREEWEKKAAAGGSEAPLAKAMLQKWDSADPPSGTLQFPIQTWTFGQDLAMVFLAGEVVVDHALRLRQELDGDRLWIHGYANDLPCYIASRRLYDEGGYEVDRSMNYYGKPRRLMIDTEDRIAEEVRNRLRDDFLKPN